MIIYLDIEIKLFDVVVFQTPFFDENALIELPFQKLAVHKRLLIEKLNLGLWFAHHALARVAFGQTAGAVVLVQGGHGPYFSFGGEHRKYF